jgi:hypothetical protein
VSVQARDSQRRNLERGYQRSRYRHQHDGGARTASRAAWEQRLDRCMYEYQLWKAGRLETKPAQNECGKRGAPDIQVRTFFVVAT